MIKVGSDFSGVGAFDQALKRLNIDYKTIFACDMDKYARQTYIANYAKSRIVGLPTEQMLELNKNGTSNTLTTVQKDNVVVYGKISQDYKIRRLTPRECFRLMDFPDSFKMPCSNSQMYKQAGNSIVVNVLAKIIEKLLK